MEQRGYWSCTGREVWAGDKDMLIAACNGAEDKGEGGGGGETGRVRRSGGGEGGVETEKEKEPTSTQPSRLFSLSL